MQPKVGDKIIAPNGFEWFIRDGETFELLDDMKKVRGTNEWRPIKPGDFIVTRGGLMRQVQGVSTALNRVHYTMGTWDELKTVDYIAPNQCDLAEGDIVYYSTFNRLGIVKRGIVYSNGKDHGLNTMWKRATPEIVVAIRDGVEHKAYYHRGTFFDKETFAAIPNFGVQKSPNPHLGKWFAYKSRSHFPDVPAFPDVAVLCTEFTNGNYVLKQPNEDLTAFVCPPSMAKLEQLHEAGEVLIGKSAVFSIETGKEITQNEKFLGPPCTPNPYKVFTEQAVQAIVSQFSIPAKIWLPGGEQMPPAKRWLLNTHFHNPKKIVPGSGTPSSTHKSNLFVLDNGRDLQFQHIYQTAYGSLVRTYCKQQQKKSITEEQSKGMQFLPVEIVLIESEKALKWLLEETELTVYTAMFGNGFAQPCRMQFLEIDGRVCHKYVAVWQDRRFEIFPVDIALGRVYYFKVVI